MQGRYCLDNQGTRASLRLATSTSETICRSIWVFFSAASWILIFNDGSGLTRVCGWCFSSTPRNQGLHTYIFIAYQWAILASSWKVLLEYVGAFTLKAGMITCGIVATEEPRGVDTNGL